jgi:GH15 family glucan-1,4-alpha-glucosidase
MRVGLTRGLDRLVLPAPICFGKLLDWDRGGHFALAPPLDSQRSSFRTYVDKTMVLTTMFRVEGGQGRVIDFFALPADGPGGDPPQIIRIVEGERGSVRFDATIAPRFDYGAVDAWIRRHGIGQFTAIGGDDGLVVVSDAPLEESGHRLESSFAVLAGDRVHFSLIYGNPAELEPEALHPPPTSTKRSRRRSGSGASGRPGCRSRAAIPPR